MLDSSLHKIIRNHRQAVLVSIMVFSIAVVEAISLYLLYQTSFQQQQERLVDTVNSQASLIEAVARFDADHNQADYPGGASAATISQVLDAIQRNGGIGETGEFLLGHQNGDKINLISPLRHQLDGKAETVKDLMPGPDRAVPMQMALQGKSGTMLARDYRGVEVLAAYDYIGKLNLGLVAKIDLAEIRHPFYLTFALVVLLGILMIVPGVLLIRRLTNDVIEQLVFEEEKVSLLLNSTGEAIYGLDMQGLCTFANPACALMLGYESTEMLVGKNIHELIHHVMESGEPQPVATCKICQAHIRGENSNQCSEYIRHRDGSYFPVEYWSQPIIKQGEIIGSVVTIVDITERLNAEAALKESEMQFRQIAETINEVFWCTNVDGSEMIYVSPAYEAIWGRSCESLYEHPQQWLTSIHADDHVRVKEAFKNKLLSNEFDEEYRIILPDGSEKWIRDRAFIVKDELGQIQRVTGIAEDITAQRLVKHSLTEQNELLERIFENTHTLIAYMDTEFNFIRANKAYLEADNKTEADLIGRNHFELYPNEENEKIFRNVVASGVPHYANAKAFEYEYTPEKGVTHWNWSLQPVYDNGLMVGVLLVLLNVTEQIKAQEAVLHNKAILQKAQEIGHFGGWDWNIATNELRWTDEVYRIFGRNVEEFPSTYTSFLEMVHPNDREAVAETVNQCLVDRVPYDIEHRIIRNDGVVRYVHEKGEVQYDDNGKPFGIKGVVQDITSRKQTEQELEGYRKNLESLVEARTRELKDSMLLLRKENEARKQIETSLVQSKEEAEQANRLKSEFLGRMSHELRTPLNAILGFSQLLEMEELASQQLECVTEIMTAGHHLLGMINEVLDLSRIETGGLKLDMQYVPLAEVIVDSIGMVRSMAEAREIEIVNNIDLDAKEYLYVDRLRFMQVIINLLTNAIKYNSSPGKVTIDREASQNDQLSVLIRDTGPGISVAAQQRIFEPFNRLGAEYTEIEGTGIGLTIARKLASMMSCQLGLDSRLGEGSTFWIICPLVNTGSKTSPTRDNPGHQVLFSAAGGTKQLLYIEDNPANLRLVQSLVSRLERVTLYSAPNAEFGIELARTKKPNLILMDINLPGMDGFAAIKQLAEIPETQFIPVVAISAAAMPRDIERGLKAGFKHYLTKPIQLSELLEVLGEELGDEHNRLSRTM